MNYFSLSQAAKEVGIGKGTLSKAVKSGKLSYIEKTSAGYKIEASELFRVFPKREKENIQVRLDTPEEIPLLREMLKREREISEREKELNKDLRERLERSENERRELSLRLESHIPRRRFLGIF